MDEATTTRRTEHSSKPKRSRFGLRLFHACAGAALLPVVLVVLAVNDLGAEPAYWAATVTSLALLGAWPFVARPRRAGLGQSVILAVGILTAMLLSFLVGSVVATIGVRTSQPASQASEPAAGA